MGLRLDDQDIYSINRTSLKDAVVIFGRGCTGVLISPDGLVITNHHCGYSRIQSHSTVENDYLKNGFWAGSKAEELACPGLEVTFLVRIEDVTNKILVDISDTLHEPERNLRVNARASGLQKEAVTGTHYEAELNRFTSAPIICSFTKSSPMYGWLGPPESNRFGGPDNGYGPGIQVIFLIQDLCG
jgi:hypothetical protein